MLLGEHDMSQSFFRFACYMEYIYRINNKVIQSCNILLYLFRGMLPEMSFVPLIKSVFFIDSTNIYLLYFHLYLTLTFYI